MFDKMAKQLDLQTLGKGKKDFNLEKNRLIASVQYLQIERGCQRQHNLPIKG